ncbi:hypothetical protein H257_13231 [Aphanomyces astaci]|uniref:Tc1-like transposase DDE domain-containing protein n=1 Tax=Aphanomyces astaci TaxID=112090 RepID=W4FXS1_APHAT|nr:hypothetical protein H257_13231 [Aphanomyces astaci]ETV71564.1 hypothetical protein H257_13231 [Aphanomyces astaci]|eukprot:XP_009838997.1 hypothetical protein H257_13231 [Aphanomyces astaci]
MWGRQDTHLYLADMASCQCNQHLANSGVLLVDRTDKLASESALRKVQRFLLHCGYNRGNKKGKKSLALTEKNTLLRDLYVRRMCVATQHIDPRNRRTVFYTDESFVHHHYNKNDISLHDPTDELDIHHSNLQPIEVVWAIIKGNVGRRYQDDTTFQEVGQRLDAACANLTSHSIFGYIRKAEYDLLDLHRHVSYIDDDNYQEDNEVAGDGSDGTVSSSASQDSANDAGF